MRIGTQPWQPDTCGCFLVLTYDRDNPDAGYSGAVDRPETVRCAFHEHLKTAQEHYDAVTTENKAKNVVVNAEVEAFGVHPSRLIYSFSADRKTVTVDQVRIRKATAEQAEWEAREAARKLAEADGITDPDALLYELRARPVKH